MLLDAPTAAGVVLRVRPIGVMRASQKGERGRVRNDRLVAVAQADRRRVHVKDVADLSARERSEIERFFVAAVALEGKELELLGWGDARAARDAITKATSAGTRRKRAAKKRAARSG